MSRSRRIAYWLFPLLLVLAGVLISMQVAWQVSRQNLNAAELRFASIGDHLAEALQDRFRSYEYGLRGARGVLITNPLLGREGFRRYLHSRDIATEFPGALGYGFIRQVPRDRLDAFVRRVRAEGVADFRISQIGRNDGPRGAAPIVALTANAFADASAACFALGMNDFIIKPVTRDVLARTLSRWVSLTHDPAARLRRRSRLDANPGETAPNNDLPGVHHTLCALADALGTDVPALVTELFRQALADALPVLTGADGRHDMDALTSIAHRLKGATAQIGALGLSEYCRLLEQAASDGDAERCRRFASLVWQRAGDLLEGMDMAGFAA